MARDSYYHDNAIVSATLDIVIAIMI